jgi:hypothetical protein
MSNTYIGQGCYVFNPTLGGAGTETIPLLQDVYTSEDNMDIDTKVLKITSENLISGLEIDPTNNNQGNRFYSTDGSSLNNLTLSPDYMYWDCDYVTGDTRVGLEFDPTGGFGATRFWKENYVTNEGSTIGLETTQIMLQSTDGTFTTNVNVYPSNFESNTTDGTSDKWIGQDTTQVLIYSTDGTNQSTIDVYDNSMALSVTDGLTTTSITIGTVSIQLDNIPSYDDDTDASSLSPGMIYQTTGLGASPLDVAGILMIKQ